MGKEKKPWESPNLKVFGTVQEITNGIPAKSFGGGDGAFYQGTAVTWKK